MPGKHEPLISYETWGRAQEVLDGRTVAPARKDISGDFPLRGFILCADCGKPISACWSKSKTGKKHPHYLCVQRGCPSKRKSIRRADVEEPFEEVLKALCPSEKLFRICRLMFRDAWELRAHDAVQIASRFRQDAAALQQNLDRVVDRLVEADSDSVVKACAARIERMDHDKRLLEDRIKHAGNPVAPFAETFELAMRFISNLWKI